MKRFLLVLCLLCLPLAASEEAMLAKLKIPYYFLDIKEEQEELIGVTLQKRFSKASPVNFETLKKGEEHSYIGHCGLQTATPKPAFLFIARAEKVNFWVVPKLQTVAKAIDSAKAVISSVDYTRYDSTARATGGGFDTWQVSVTLRIAKNSKKEKYILAQIHAGSTEQFCYFTSQPKHMYSSPLGMLKWAQRKVDAPIKVIIDRSSSKLKDLMRLPRDSEGTFESYRLEAFLVRALSPLLEHAGSDVVDEEVYPAYKGSMEGVLRRVNAKELSDFYPEPKELILLAFEITRLCLMDADNNLPAKMHGKPIRALYVAMDELIAKNAEKETIPLESLQQPLKDIQPTIDALVGNDGTRGVGATLDGMVKFLAGTEGDPTPPTSVTR